MEEWKDIKDYEGLYQVSNLGNVKSVERYTKHSRGGLRIVKERMLKFNNCKGYFIVSLFKNGIDKRFAVHQLVAMSFLNHTRCGFEKVINHIDFNTQNNNVVNLEVVSNRENSNRKHIKSTSKYTGVYMCKTTNKWVSCIYDKNKRKYLGLFKDEYQAHLAYEKALVELNNIKRKINQHNQ